MKAVRFDKYGDSDVLRVADVPIPGPAQGEVLVKVKAASINPGEAKIREGQFHAVWPATFPSGEGSDLAGIVTKMGVGAEGVKATDEVIGFTDRRASHAEYVIVEAQNLTRKPANVSWEVAGPANHDWLRAHGVKPVAHGDSLAHRLREAGIDAFIDTYGHGYVKLAIELGVAPDRINTIIDFAAAHQYGVKAEGSQAALNAAVLAELAALIAAGDLEVPIAATFPLADVRAAFKMLEQGHSRGKIVLLP